MAFISTHLVTSDDATTATGSITVPAAATYAVLITSMRGSDSDATELTSATLGGVNFTLNKTNLRQFNGFQAGECGWMGSADLPASGSQTLTGTRGTGTDGFNVCVAFFDGSIDQSEPAATLNGADSSPSDPFVTSAPAGTGVLIDGISTSGTGAGFSPTAGSPTQTEQEDNNADGNKLAISTRSSTASDMSWDTSANTQRTTHIVLLVADDAVTAGLTGTMTASVNEDDITTGGKTIIVTLAGDTFKAAGTGPIGSTADTQALIDGFDAAASPTNGWNNEVRDKAATTEVVRTSSTVATWTVAAQAGYDIASTETVTGTIPTDVLVTGAGAITATPTFTVSAVGGASIAPLAAHHLNQMR